ncbi:hypothetical protein [Deinococcus multiflagellatus]|uniref:Uncharacterized protein n=1 Tax=Deinococcus multiflagellatus TaxID=1656887 RepID=A0ABW1ZTL5_9DEIO|nr:hypothetical protein [Deinococcus multiflagellatus]
MPRVLPSRTVAALLALVLAIGTIGVAQDPCAECRVPLFEPCPPC